ncbi:Elp3 domain-containing protein [Mycena indigotica]|uniref:Elp3 domain-containing protein n=1 Tax=Mycena indigotica TaxID=2126181 RepID=A0A8H6SXQ2_9AGAR|nr:Elp3 domain-containing protein [Mycena indigotica]KAF7307208.1 Elp3 domain-containing protein [Mycena indigotica]
MQRSMGWLVRRVHQSTGSARLRVQEKISQIDKISPISPALVDTFRRRHDYLRISLTERCNLRCFYCMPSEGVELSPNENILSNEEVLRLARLFVKSGVTKIRLTGGEPTVRKGILEIIAGLNDLRQYGLKSIGMTSNGVALHRRIPEFVHNGLTHLNLSLDTLDEFRFEIMTRRRGFPAVLKALETALEYLPYVKLNVVVVKGLNDIEVLDFVEMTKDRPIYVRFIEFMPFTGNKWDAAKMVPSSELLERISKRHPLIERASDELNDTARTWKIPGYVGNIGFISSMSDHFCATCNRLRITADGQIKVCLFDAKEVSLRDRMRLGASDMELLDVIQSAVLGKQEKHAGMKEIDVVNNRPMILIGGSQPRRARHPIFRPQVPVQLHQKRFNSTNAPRLSHLDSSGRAAMVDVSPKVPTQRSATASGRISIPKIAYQLVTSTYPDSESTEAFSKARRKGDALTVAHIAAITGAKQTSNLIPLCHPLQLNNVSVALTPEASALENGETEYSIVCRATVTCEGKTGVEMEALTAVSIGLLTVWDMLKAVAGRDMVIKDIVVTAKSGGKHDFTRSD